MRKQSYTILTLAWLMWSCGDDIPPRAPNFVVEAFITADMPVNNIKVKGTSPIDSIDVTNEPIADAIVTLSYSAGNFPLDYNDSTGLYEFLDEGVRIITGESYALEVMVGERTATAMTIIPDYPQNVDLPDSVLNVPQLELNFLLREQISDLFFNERITLQWDSIPGEMYFVVIEERENEPDPILPEEVPAEAQELLSSFKFISEPSESGRFEIIGVALQNYGDYVAKVFTVNEEYADLFDNLEQDSRDLNEPPSNVQNAQGIFTGFAVDSVDFEVRR